MILSLHLVELPPSATFAALRPRPAPAKRAGLIWWQKTAAVPLAAGIFPPPRPTGLAVTAAWTDDAALDDFLANDRSRSHSAPAGARASSRSAPSATGRSSPSCTNREHRSTTASR